MALEKDADSVMVAEEDEDSESDESQISSEERCHLIVGKMLEDLHNRKKPVDKSEETTEDGMLNGY